jgi:hypothetical protein
MLLLDGFDDRSIRQHHYVERFFGLALLERDQPEANRFSLESEVGKLQ